MDELARVWYASDYFDSKVLQFVGIVVAGSLAAAAIVAGKLPLAIPPKWLSIEKVLVVSCISVLLTLFWFSIRATSCPEALPARSTLAFGLAPPAAYQRRAL